MGRDRQTDRHRQRQRERADRDREDGTTEREQTAYVRDKGFVCWLVGCLTSQQQASVSQGRICTGQFYVLPH